MPNAAFVVLLIVSAWTTHAPVVSHRSDEVMCTSTDPPAYYAIDLVSTKRLPGTRRAKGAVDMTFRSSPFGVSIGSGGQYRYDLRGRIEGMKPPSQGIYVAWVSTPDLKQVRSLGPIDDMMAFEGEVEWQKFLVIITLEESFDARQARWKGPVALRGLSRSGLMHTMAGHGPFQSEPCASFGFR